MPRTKDEVQRTKQRGRRKVKWRSPVIRHFHFPLYSCPLSRGVLTFGFCLLSFDLRVRRALRSLRPVFHYRLVSVLGPGPWPSLTRQMLPGVRQRLASALSNRLHSIGRSLRAKESLSPKRLKSRTLCQQVHGLGFEPWFRSSSRRSSWRPYPRPSRDGLRGRP